MTQTLPILAGFYFAIGLGFIFNQVRKKKISEKYGIYLLFIYFAALIASCKIDPFILRSYPVSSWFFLVAVATALMIAINFSIYLTQQSLARKQSIQEVALLRFELEHMKSQLDQKFKKEASSELVV